ncbi:MAG: ABC transporter ATP-binding protein [Verrucomicrobiales bacterium]|jgi:zinc transport system ATP-binding protein|nr:ABC transporter ATP-binding protein [Verrucomicrobiales bacterium]
MSLATCVPLLRRSGKLAEFHSTLFGDSLNPVESADIVVSEGLCFGYGRQLVLEDVSFSIPEGESLCMIGPNGGGKSTLLKLMLGLLEPNRGSLSLFGKPADEACKQVGYVPQAVRFDPLFPITAIDIVLMGRLDRHRFGFYSKQCREVSLQALTEVGLEEFANRPFSDLSGGQRQRVLIARALACEPELLLLDEPTANIDLSVEEQFIETLASLKEKMTILMVTHDLDLISEIGDSVLCVNHRVHRHSLPLSGETIREIYSGVRRVEHDRRARHVHGDHSACDHD